MKEQRGLTRDQAIEILKKYPDLTAHMQRDCTMTNGPRWKWFQGDLVLFKDMVDGPHPCRPVVYADALTSSDWIVYEPEWITNCDRNKVWELRLDFPTYTDAPMASETHSSFQLKTMGVVGIYRTLPAKDKKP